MCSRSCYPLSSVNVSKECDRDFMDRRQCWSEREYAYRMSYNVTRACDPSNMPQGEYCQQSNVPADKIDVDSDLRPQPVKFRGRGNLPNTMLVGTSPYRAEGEGHLDPRLVDLESRLFMAPMHHKCDRVLNGGTWGARFDIMPEGTVAPGVEPFPRGGVPTRCPTYYSRV